MTRTLLVLLVGFTAPARGEVPLPDVAPAAAPVVSSSRRPISLEDALRLTAGNNQDLAAARAQFEQVKAQASRVWGAILPEISLQGSLVRTSAPARLDYGAFLDSVGTVYAISQKEPSAVPPPLWITAQNSAYGSLLVSQILFTPQLILIPAADEGAEAARLGSLEAREQVLLGTARVFLGLEGIAQLEFAAHEAELVALKREKDTRAQMSVGMAVEVASLRAQSETAAARNTLAQLAGTREQLLALLESLTGEPVRPLEGSSKPDFGAAAPEASEPWNATYLVRANTRGAEALSAFQAYDRMAWLPTLTAQVKGNYNSNSGLTGQNLSYDLILAVNIPLYDRGARYANMHEDDARFAEARAKLESSRQKAKANWMAARANLQAAEAALAQAESQTTLATRAQKQLESAVQAGVSTALELSDIDNKRFLAASSAAQARSQVEIRKVEVAAAEGRLAKVVGLE
jgi:outer membrane protein TolC